jgi:hypothetical protein
LLWAANFPAPCPVGAYRSLYALGNTSLVGRQLRFGAFVIGRIGRGFRPLLPPHSRLGARAGRRSRLKTEGGDTEARLVASPTPPFDPALGGCRRGLPGGSRPARPGSLAWERPRQVHMPQSGGRVSRTGGIAGLVGWLYQGSCGRWRPHAALTQAGVRSLMYRPGYCQVPRCTLRRLAGGMAPGRPALWSSVAQGRQHSFVSFCCVRRAL